MIFNLNNITRIIGEKKKKMVSLMKLPDDIVHSEILPRVSVKSAIQCKSVSKSWKALISGDVFVEQHYEAQPPEVSDGLIVNKNYKLSFLHRYEESTLSYPRTM